MQDTCHHQLKISLEQCDPELNALLNKEANRQEDHIELIASENFTYEAVMEAQGSCLTNKYAEGLPGKRYYGGCEWVDEVECLAINRAKDLFGANYANVQPHSGAQANMAAFLAFLNPSDTFLGFSLAHGGHLTHGSPVNISGKYFNAIPYGLDTNTGLIDYDELESLAKTHKPKLIIGGASAYSRIIDFERISKIAKEVGALFMVDMAHIAGLVAAGLHPNPVDYADVVTTTTHKTLKGPRGGLILTNNEEHAKLLNRSVFPGIQGGPLMHVIAAKAVCFKLAKSPDFVDYQNQTIKNAQAMANELINLGYDIVSGGTDNHLLLLDLRNKGITGKALEQALGDVNITANKNAVPNDPKSPFVTSGVRFGSPAATSRGFNENDFRDIANWVDQTIKTLDNPKAHLHIKEAVIACCAKYPLYKKS